MASMSARDVAEYFLRLADKESGDLISNLKIQKLVYYAQGINLAATGQPLFNDELVAWIHGPVVEDLYHCYKVHEDGPIEPDPAYKLPKIDADTKQLLDEVYRVLGQYSAWKLREMTHGAQPWINAYEKSSNPVISNEDMAEYFRPYVKVK